MSGTIDSIVRWWIRERPERIALSQAGDHVTYAELDGWLGRVAVRLSEMGVGVGDRVCIYAENSLEWCVAALAAIRAGGVVTGLHIRMASAEVAWLLGDYAPKVLVREAEGAHRLADIGLLTSRSGAPVAAPAQLDVAEIRALRHGEPADVVRQLDPDALTVVVTTSGSTARPKGVMLTNRTMINHISASAMEEYEAREHPRIYIVAPLNTSAGVLLLIHFIVLGGSIYVETRFEPVPALELIEREKINIFHAAPVFLQRIVDRPEFETADVSSIRIAYTGGMAVPPALLKKWSDKGVIIRQLYGQTECGGFGSINPPRLALSHPDKCGHGSPVKDIAIIDAEGNRLPAGQPGQILLRGPGHMIGYWNDPEATAQVQKGGWLHTGDIGVIDEEGLLKFVDRLKDMIISGGLNISAAEVERVILEFPGVEEAAVISAPDERFGETPMAVLYGPAPIDVAALIDHCNQNLAGYKVPRYVVAHEEPLPRLATGKLAKPALRAQYKEPDSLPPRVR